MFHILNIRRIEGVVKSVPPDSDFAFLASICLGIVVLFLLEAGGTNFAMHGADLSSLYMAPTVHSGADGHTIRHKHIAGLSILAHLSLMCLMILIASATVRILLTVGFSSSM